ncbi:unnamed protein product [Miscanthus lutarioriparius]|uniref:Uncharacterized protein n=1 Tax=Miscanthus lutarioriparius TaxID=422564 RepID=A0A811QGW7_9POAL|nr:unnamed protein product [Miscanthus lutarioriparius]
MVGMEATAVSAAVSGMLKLAGNKLAPLVFKEYSSIVGVKDDLRDLAQEINIWLEEAGDRDVDDVVDEFQLKAEKYEADSDAGFVSKYLHTKPKAFIFQCQAAKKIKKIKKTIDVLVKQRSILNSVVGNNPVSHINNTAVSKQTLPFVDGAKIIGREQVMHQTISKLLETDDQQRINIVSIVGLGGSGKTILAQLVFDDAKTIKSHFTVRLWVHVSQEFDVKKLIKKLFDAIPDENSEGLSLMNMARKILDKLTNNRFLLVLDDVWNENRIQWEEFMTCHPYEDYSRQLFQQSFGNDVKDFYSEFQEVGKEIVNKCVGVPLAIKVVAGVLRVKKRLEQWQAIKESNLLDVEGREHQVSASLWLSYFNMPSHLKQCFTICSIFPKGDLIDKDQLIDQWIAHDMVIEDVVKDLEIIGNDYFSQLVQMYFIQDVKDGNDEKVKYPFWVMRFHLSYRTKKAVDFTKICRYFSITEHTRHLPPKNTFREARAMYIAEDDDFIFGKSLKKAKHLRSITVENVHTSALTAILQTKNLRYLNISRLKYLTLPEVISEIWSLQALHVTSSSLVKLPESIGRLQKLRVVNLSYCCHLTSLPDSIGNCIMISSIDLFGCDKFATLPSSISRNKRLRVLRLGNTKLERLPSSITALENLECLDLHLCSELVELPEGIGNLKKLVVLNLQGCGKLRGIPKGISQLTQLEKLGLFVMGRMMKIMQRSQSLKTLIRLAGS